MEISNVAKSVSRASEGPMKKAAAPNRPLYATPPSRHLHPVRRFGKLVAGASAMHEVFDVLARFAPTEVSVTLLGETGTGKDVVAHALHEQSSRSSAPFVVFDCGAIAPNLAESELLGHERGAFTGAVSSHAGAFERAHGGTLFLDEIGELPVDLQPRLLRVLESRRVRRVGGTQDRPLDVRVVAATHRDLEGMIEEGTFREDLFYRLDVVPIEIPPLRERRQDIPALADHFRVDVNAREGRTVPGFALDVIQRLGAYDWPGNVRELENLLERLMVLCESPTIAFEDLPDQVRRSDQDPGTIKEQVLGGRKSLGTAVDEFEREIILEALGTTSFNQTRAADMLGTTRRILKYRMDKLGIQGPER
jgi:DNA-binding NtrC family response regulator